MASEDFIIRIVLDAQSKIAPVMAAAAAEADKVKKKFSEADVSATALSKRLDQLEGRASKARDTFRSMNPTLDATDRKLKQMSGTLALVNNSLGKLDTKAEEAAGALGGLALVIDEIEDKLQGLGHKMEELGARTFTPKVELDGTEVAQEKADALALKLLALERKRRTVRIGIEQEILDREIAEVVAKMEALGDEGIELYIRVDDSQLEEAGKLRADINRRETNRFLADEEKKREAQRKTSEDHIGQLARLARQSYKDSTPAELESTLRQIEAVRQKMRALNQEHEANRVLLGVQYEQQDKLGKIADKNEQDRQAKHTRDIEKSYERITAAVNKAARDKQVAEDRANAASDRSDREFESARVARLRRRSESFQSAYTDLQDDSRGGSNPFKVVSGYKDDRAEFERAHAELVEEARRSGVDIPVGVKLSREDRAVLDAQLAKIGMKREHVKILVDYDRNDTERLGNRFAQTFQDGFRKASAFSDNASGSGGLFTSSGLTTAAIKAAAIFAEPLLSALTAVGGALVAVGVAAGQAAAGLVGLAIAGAAQAVPVVGLLAAAFSRVQAVMKVVQLAQAERDKNGTQGAALDNARANALDGLKSAQEGVQSAIRGVADAERNLADAQDRVREAQEALNKARQDGLRVIEDAILAERRASLAAMSSELALGTAVASGGGGLIQAAQIDADSSRLDANRQRVDTRALVAGGVDATPGVISAKKGLEDALRGVDNAKRALADANRAVDKARDGVDKAARGVDQAAEKMGAAANAYEIALGKLSKGERTLLGSIENFKKLFEAGSALRGISDVIVESFARALDQVATLLNDPAILNSLQGLAGAMSGAIDDLAKVFTTGPMRDALIFFTDEATKNVGTVGKIIGNLASIFANVGRAASGPFASALRGVNGWLEGIVDKTSPAKAGGMRDFFQKSLEPIKSFLRLGGSLVNLFLALAGPGGATDEGVRGIDGLTTSVDNATRYIRSHGSEVRNFFHGAIDAAGDVGRVIVGIGKFLIDTFDPNSVRAFADFLVGTIFPVLTQIVKILGFFVRGILSIFNNETIGGIARTSAVMMILVAAIFALERAVLVAMARFAAWAATSLIFQGIVSGVTLALKGLRIAFLLLADGNPIAWIVLGIAALVALYLKFEGFRNVVNGVFSWVKDHWKLLPAILLGPFGWLISSLLTWGPKLIRAISGPFNQLKDWIGNIAGPLFGPLGKSISAIGDIGKSIFGGIKSGIGGLASSIGLVDSAADKARKKADAAHDAAKKQAEDLAAAVATANAVINGAKNPLDYANQLVRNASRSASDDRPELGNVGAGSYSKQPKAKKKDPFNMSEFSTYDAKITPEEAKQIKALWEDVAKTSDSATDRIAKSVRDMRVGIETTLDRLVKIAKGDFGDFWDAGRKNFANLDNSIEHSMDAVTKTITSAMADIAKAFYDGFKYIVSTTNESLKAFDATPARISISAPSAATRKAVGGWVGNAGERGKDAVHTVLGRGEAVLTGAQQYMVNAAMSGRDSLDSIFNRTKGYHAGGAGDAIGFAQGGFTGPFGTGSAFTPIANFAKSKFGLTMTAGKDNHSTLTASGNVSDHSKGWAGDFSNGVLTPQEDAFNKFIKTKIPQVVKQLIWRNKDQFQGFPIPDHEDHVHLAIKEALAFNAGRMAKILQSASRGLDISSLLVGLDSPGGGSIDHVQAPTVSGPKGNQRNLATSIIERVTRGANAFIDRQAGKLNVGTGDGKINEAQIRGALGGREVFDFFTGNGYKPFQAAAFVGNFVQESGLNPSIVQPNGEGHGIAQWGGGRFAALQAFARSRDTQWTDGKTQLAFVLHELRGSESAANRSIKGSTSLAEAVRAVGVDYERFGIQGNRLGPALEALKAYSGGGNPGRAQGGYAWGGFQANGGEYTVSSPTLFVAGEAGTETATFTPRGKSSGDSSTAARIIGKAIGESLTRDLSDPIKLLARELTRFAGYTNLTSRGNASAGNVPGILGIVDDVQDAMGQISLRSKRGISARLTKLGKALDFFSSDEGPLALIGDQITARTAALTRSLSRRQFGNGRQGRRLQDPGVIGTAEINNLREARQGLDGEDDAISRALRRARTGLSKAKTDAQRQLFQASINRLVTKQGEVRDALAQNAQSIVERQEQMQQELLDKSNAEFDAQRSVLDKIRRINTARGRDDQNIALFDTQADIAKQQIGDLTSKFWAAYNSGNTTLAKSIQEQLWELNTSVIELANQKIQAVVDLVNNNASDRNAGIERNFKVAEMFGQPGATFTKDNQLADSARRQIADLQAPLQDAINAGNQTQADKIRAQIQDLNNTITEMTVGAIQANIDEINRTGDRRDAGIGLQNRLLDLQARAGDALGALRGRAGTLASTGASLTSRRDGLQRQLEEAARLGDTRLVEDLSDKISDLNVSIEENAQAIKDNTFQVRKLSIDIVNGTANRTIGLLGSVQTINNNVAALTGASTVASTFSNLQAVATALSTAAQGLTAQAQDSIRKGEFDPALLGGISGTDLLRQLTAAFQAGPGQFASTLQSLAPAIAAFEQTLGPDALSAFQGIVDGLVANTTATTENTQQIAALNGAVTQTFSSTAWTTFRSAIFDGNGGLLPQYDTGSLMSARASSSTGFTNSTGGSSSIATKLDGSGRPMASDAPGDNINLNVTTPTEVLDGYAVGEQVSYIKNNRGRL